MKEFVDHLSQGSLRVRRFPGQQLIQNEPQAINVRLGGQRLVADLFRGHVHGRAKHLSRPGLPAVSFQDLGDAKIGEIGVAVLVQQDVGRLDIPVDHPLLVSHGQTGGNLIHQYDRLLILQGA